MSAPAISLREDIEKLAASGLRVRILDGKSVAHLLVDRIPAVTPAKEIQYGTLYCPLELDHDRRVTGPANHQCYWIGEMPSLASGAPFEDLISSKVAQDKGDEIKTAVDFSRRPDLRENYLNYYEKIWTYVNLLHAEALKIDSTVKPTLSGPTFVQSDNLLDAQKRVFRYPDMASTRAGIGAMSERLMVHRVAIVGVGGTGSYVLDLVAKTMVQEIHLFDGDDFQMHNAFRAPGAPDKAAFDRAIKKVQWFAELYGHMHLGIRPHPYHVSAENLEELREMSFVFVCVDDSIARGIIVRTLVATQVPFVDVGMDMEIMKDSGAIGGSCRVSSGAPGAYDHIEKVVPMQKLTQGDIYRNIQVADMNMLNAALAVGKWKKYCGFYADDQREGNLVYTLDFNGISRSHQP